MNQPAEDRDRDLRGRLAALRTDLPQGDFQASLRRRLLAAGPPEDPSPWRRLAGLLQVRQVFWPALGIAAGVAAFLLLSSPTPPAPGAEAARLATRLPASQVAVVRLTLSADGPVEAARIRVSLPPGLSFWAEGRELAQRDFEWTQPLATGDNEIPIAVRGQRPGRYRIGVETRIGADRIDDEIMIEVTGG
jgi:hypothetical protein